MKIAVIVAIDLEGGIGFRGKLPWGRIPADLKRFRKLTMGYPLITGRTTFESLPAPLSGRSHIVLTRQADYWTPPGCYVAHSFGRALSIARFMNLRDSRSDRRKPLVFVAGGAEVYSYALHSYADYIYMTRICAKYEADTFFPPYDALRWVAIQPTEVATWEGIQLFFEVYRRLW